MIKKIAVAYCRYSSLQQREESIVRQLESIKGYCDRNNLELVEEYIDEAQSGTSDRRDGFQRMIDDAENSRWDFIVVYKNDRFSRDVANSMHYKKLLSKLGIRVLSVIEDFDESSPEGNLFGLMTMGLSQFYVENLKRESFAGIMQNARRCMSTGGTPPLGYDLDEELKMVINEREAESIRYMFDLAIEGYAYKDIALKLNEKGYRTKTGKLFTANLYDYLRNRKYIGEYVYNRASKRDKNGSRNNHRRKPESEIVRIPGGVPQIVDERIFFTQQRKMDARKGRFFAKSSKGKYLLTGVITCSNCGKSIGGMVGYGGRDKKPRVRYRCHSKTVDPKCNVRDINATYYEKFVTGLIDDMLLTKNKKNLVNLINESMDGFKEFLNTKLEGLDKTIEYNAAIVTELTERVTRVRSSADRVLQEQINEYMDIVIGHKNEKMFYLEDLKALEKCYLKDIESRLHYFKEIQRQPEKKQQLIRRLVSRIYQGNDFIKVNFRLNAFLPYQLYNDFVCEHREYRSNIALKYNNKYIKPLFK